jgi:DNA-binding transcriptional LysR family regulator
VLRHADALLDLAGDAEAELRAVVRETPECVRLGGFQTSTEAVMATALEAFWARFPQTRVTLLEADPIDHLEGLRAGRLDLALVFDHPEVSIADDDRLVVRSVHEDPMLLVLPEGHALAAAGTVPLAALGDARWLEGAGPEATSSVFLMRACERLGLTPEIAFACGNYYAVQGLVARGMGIALIPELATRHRVDGTVLRSPADVRPARRIGVARLRARTVAPHVAAMERAIADAFERYAAARAAASITAS